MSLYLAPVEDRIVTRANVVQCADHAIDLIRIAVEIEVEIVDTYDDIAMTRDKGEAVWSLQDRMRDLREMRTATLILIESAQHDLARAAIEFEAAHVRAVGYG